MEFYEREFFISRICAGYLRYYVNSQLTLIIKPPNIDIQYQAQEKYRETYDFAMSDKVFTDDDVRKFLTEYRVWDDNLEEYVTNTKTGLLHQIETFKIQLYQSALDITKQKKIREYLQTAKNEFIRLIHLRHQYDYITCHGLATYARWYYIIQNSTYYEDGKQYTWDNTTVQQVMTYFQNNIIGEDTHRLLAHTEPWSSKWSAIKMNGSIFSLAGSEMTDEQNRLLSWTGLYDNIAESTDCPPKSIIDDDDMLDGWLILERIERENEQSKKRNEDAVSQNPKIANADEVFVMAKTKEDASNINRLNTAQSSMIKNVRLKQVAAQGTVTHKDFRDVRQEKAMQANQAYINKMKESR